MSTWTKGGLRPALLRALVVTVFVVGAACSSDGGKSSASKAGRDTSTTTTTAVVGSLSPTTAQSATGLATNPTTLRTRWNLAISQIGGGILLQHLKMDRMTISAAADSAQAKLGDLVVVSGPLSAVGSLASLHITVPQPTGTSDGRITVTRDYLPRLIVAAMLPSGRSAVDLETKAIADQIAIANWNGTTDRQKSVTAEGLEFTVVATGSNVFAFDVRKPS